MFRAEQADLLRDLHDLPRNAAVRKINELVKRARMARVHAQIVGHLKSQMPYFGQQSKQKQLLENLADEFFAVMKKVRHPVCGGDGGVRFIVVVASLVLTPPTPSPPLPEPAPPGRLPQPRPVQRGGDDVRLWQV